jgi:hypothetical protein
VAGEVVGKALDGDQRQQALRRRRSVASQGDQLLETAPYCLCLTEQRGGAADLGRGTLGGHRRRHGWSHDATRSAGVALRRCVAVSQQAHPFLGDPSRLCARFGPEAATSPPPQEFLDTLER